MSEIVITGATGYIGGELALALAKDGHTVHAIVRPHSSARHLTHPSIHIHYYDGTLASLERMAADCEADIVIHVAAHYANPYDAGEMDAMLEANIRFGAHLTEAFTAHGTPHFIFTGSHWQYAEDGAYRSNTFYAATKSAYEQLLLYYVQHRKIAAMTLYLGDVYGNNDPNYKLFSLLAKACETGKALEMTPGEQQMCLVHIDDVTQAYKLAIRQLQEAPPASHRHYFVAGPKRRLKDIVETYLGQAPKSTQILWGKLPYRPGQIMIPFTEPLLPGWAPRVTLEEGIGRLQHGS